ncbi:hypothetical protein BHE90_010256 [Fusarium euwallaceae]|uniref:Uncharacterized protein n=4 Tax=Fusarium solani species complex TaxID=232080 RepID=A0A3M2RNP4_9HYPO|nr:hypothetical protein CDV36_013482 [Fusarium kuroshium]RSL40609.1 hypothetical protein CEP51_016678 [Fusarium floridanum]RSM05222.1 hypothetical protein CEP52_006444 [Fusarium oligoseptatum]RTE75289.1 hypothetical protein BHE90_010256 [Fusarium euwallaceae]
MEERCSSRASGTTYHSFNDTELSVEPPRPPVTYDSKSLQQLEHLQLELQRQQREALNREQQVRRPGTATKMQRQDSGYESNTPPRRASSSNTSSSNSRPSVARRSSNGSSKDSSVGGVRSRFRNRPSLRRAAQTTHPVQTARTSNQSLHLVRTNTGNQQPAAFFHFPSPDPVQLADTAPEVDTAPTPVPSPPPQTTHYWTSDRTRRLEYAAIDAATRGVKGWIMRHLVPDCFVSRENRHVSFDDDSGSVRRYRLELEDDRDEKVAGDKPVRRRKGWRFWRRRKVEAQPAAYI